MNEVWFRGQKHCIYSEDEARLRGIVVTEDDWRTAEIGSWVKTDTGYVVQLLDVGAAGSTPWIRTCCGTFPARRDDDLGHDVRANRYNLSGTQPAWSITRKVEAFARLYARCGNARQAFKMAFPDAKSEAYIKLKGKKFLDLPAVQEVVKDERELILGELGIDRRDIMVRMKGMLDDLEESEAVEKMNLKFRILKFFNEAMDKVVDVSTTITKTDTFEITGSAVEAAEHGVEPKSRIEQKTVVRVDGAVNMGEKGGSSINDESGRDQREGVPG